MPPATSRLFLRKSDSLNNLEVLYRRGFERGAAERRISCKFYFNSLSKVLHLNHNNVLFQISVAFPLTGLCLYCLYTHRLGHSTKSSDGHGAELLEVYDCLHRFNSQCICTYSGCHTASLVFPVSLAPVQSHPEWVIIQYSVYCVCSYNTN